MSQLEQQKFVCIDCETTGLDPKQDRVIELAAICFDFSNIYESKESLVDPLCEIPESSIAIHHITQEMVQGKPTIDQVLPGFLALIQDHIIVGHSVQFDIDILINSAMRHNIPCKLMNNPVLDTLRMARLYGECPINSLEFLRKHFNIPLEGAHRAMSDVVVNKEVFKYLAKRFKTTKSLFDELAKPILMTIMPLGKYKGRPFKEIPLQYLQWIAHREFDQDLIFSIKTELKKRGKGNLFSQVTNPFVGL